MAGRVLHQRGLVAAIGMARGSSGGTGGDRLAKFVAGDRLKDFVSAQLREVTENPLKFRTTTCVVNGSAMDKMISNFG